MKRIAILGAPGSGKSTLAKQLGVVLALPIIHLDDLFWDVWHGGPDPTPTQIRAKLDEVANLPEWIIDGIHGGQPSVDARRIRLDAADMIVYLDLPPLLCVSRLMQRRLKIIRRHAGILRPNERLTWAIIQAAWNFRNRNMKDEVLAYAPLKRVVVLTNSKQVTRFVRTISTTD